MPSPIFPLPSSTDVQYFPDYLDPTTAQEAYQTLQQTLDWKQYPIKMFGKTFLQPRLIAWYGDAGVAYRYAQTHLLAEGWTPLLEQFRTQLQHTVQAPLNCVLANYYRDGQDSMGWHSDDEPELGPEPIIASLSLGAVRRLKFRHRQDAQQKAHIDLSPGSLLLMRGHSQRDWQHQVAKTKRVQEGRINLTYRFIAPTV